MEFREITLAVEDTIATITLNRPEKLNALTHRMAAELIEAFDRTDAQDAVRAVVLTGAGRAFCAGADLSGGGDILRHDRTEFRPDRDLDYGGSVSRRMFESRKPIIAAINGAAVGIGATASLPADVRLCSDTARFGFVFTRRGILPEAASSWFLPRVVGISRALEWVLSGRLVDAQEALDAGLVRSVHAPEDLLPAAYAMARSLTEQSAPVANAIARRMLWSMLGEPSPVAAHELDSAGVFHMGPADDVREGVMSFLEKRDPQFPLRVSEDLPAFYLQWQAANDVRVPPGGTLGEAAALAEE